MGKSSHKPSCVSSILLPLFDSVQHGEASVSYLIAQARKAREVFNGTKTARPLTAPPSSAE